MADAISIGLAGLKAAETRVAIRAQNVANMNTPGYAPLSPVQTSTAVGPTVRAAKATGARPPAAFMPEGLTPGGADSLAADLVDMRLAAAAYGASVAVIDTSNEMLDTLLDVVT